MSSRRHFFETWLVLGAALLACPEVQQRNRQPKRGQELESSHAMQEHGFKRRYSGPAVHSRQWRQSFQFHCRAGELANRSSKTVDVWGFNEVPPANDSDRARDRVRVVFDNHLQEPTSIYCYGFEIRTTWPETDPQDSWEARSFHSPPATADCG